MIRFLADALRFYFEFHATLRRLLRRVHPRPAGGRRAPSIRDWSSGREPAAVDVDASGGPGDGQTIADWRGSRAGRRTPTSSVEVDAAEFGRRLVERVGALAAARA